MPHSTQEFRSLLQRTDDPNPKLGTDQTLLLFDPGTKQVVKKKPVLSILGARVDAYIVTTNRRIRFGADPYLVTSKNDALRVDISCELRCPPGAESTLVNALAGNSDPAAELERHIHEGVRVFAESLGRDNQDIIRDFFRHKKAWESFVANHLLRTTGLVATVVALDVGGESLDDWNFKFDPSPVNVADCRDQLSFSFVAKLGVPEDADARQLAVLHLRNQGELKDALHRATTRWITDHCSIEQFCFKEVEIEKELHKVLQGVAKGHGRIVTYFRWEPKTPWTLPRFDRILRHKHACRIKDCDEEVEVEHTVLLALKNLASFLNRKPENIERWVFETLERITQNELFERDYVTVAIGFKPGIENKIRDDMRKAAEERGLEVRQFSSVPNVEPLRLLQGFSFSVEDEFSTKYPRVKVKLRITGVGRVTNLEAIRKYVRPRQDLVLTHIQPEIKHVVDTILQGMNPGRFYLEFDSPRARELDNRHSTPKEVAARSADVYDNSVELQLTKRIKGALEKAFSVECSTLTVVPTETELTERLRQLVNARPKLDLEVTPQNGATVKLHMGYRVVNPVPEFWEVFLQGNKSPEVEIADITDLMRLHAERIMNFTLPIQVLLFTSNEGRRLLETALFSGWPPPTSPATTKSDPRVHIEGLQEVVAKFHGLAIEPTGFTREISSSEQHRVAQTERHLENQVAEQQAKLEHLKESLADLRGQERDLAMAVEPDHETLRNVRAQIADLEKEIAVFCASPDAVAPLSDQMLPHQPHMDAFAQSLLPGTSRIGIAYTPPPVQDASRETTASQEVPGNEPSERGRDEKPEPRPSGEHPG